MKIWELDQPQVGDIVEFETDDETVVEGLIIGETENGYIYEFSESGYTELNKGLVEADYRGREVPLGRPLRGDVKKFKVYVKNKQGKVVKVNFGDPNMRIRKSNPARRKSFRARHNCNTPGPRDKARYWSCRKW